MSVDSMWLVWLICRLFFNTKYMSSMSHIFMTNMLPSFHIKIRLATGHTNWQFIRSGRWPVPRLTNKIENKPHRQYSYFPTHIYYLTERFNLASIMINKSWLECINGTSLNPAEKWTKCLSANNLTMLCWMFRRFYKQIFHTT